MFLEEPDLAAPDVINRSKRSRLDREGLIYVLPARKNANKQLYIGPGIGRLFPERVFYL